MKKFFHKIASYGHELGTIYYAWSLLASLSAGAYALYKNFADRELGQTFFYFFLGMGVVAVITIPLLILMVIRQGGKKDVANPALKLKSRKAIYDITPAKTVKRQTMVLEALGDVKYYQFSLVTTGESKPQISLGGSGVGSLVGPIQRRNAEIYQVVFTEPLKKGNIVNLIINILLDDPKVTMKPYASDSFVSCCSYGSFEAEYNFKPMPKAVHSEVVMGQGSTTLAPVQLLMPQNGKYRVVENNVIPGAAYSVSWIW